MKYSGQILVALLLWALAGAAHADFPLAKYRELRGSPKVAEKLRDYVTGLGRGIFWSNAMLETKKMRPLFCMPRKLSLDQGLVESLLDQEIRNPAQGVPYKDDALIEVILLNAFMSRFPCEQ